VKKYKYEFSFFPLRFLGHRRGGWGYSLLEFFKFFEFIIILFIISVLDRLIISLVLNILNFLSIISRFWLSIRRLRILYIHFNRVALVDCLCLNRGLEFFEIVLFCL